MALHADRFESNLFALDEQLARFRSRVTRVTVGRIDRWRSHAGALRFHLRGSQDRPLLVAILGGTGTGKSTMMNRLVGTEVSATSLRRTFTNGPVAVAGRESDVPAGWFSDNVTIASAESIPVRGEDGSLVVVPLEHPLTARVTLVDTPDLDGDRLDHHSQADRVFRWAQAVVFLVTPEKYQMTELPGYFRLARRYELPSLFVMNKCEERAVVEDFRVQLGKREWPAARVFAVPREDAAYEPPAEVALPALRDALRSLEVPNAGQQTRGLTNRSADLMGRLRDQILMPLRADRREIDRLLSALASLKTSSPGLDVSPLTQQLQRRMQEQSVLYLMGPKRILERVRQVPGILARLPRTAWDLLVRGEQPTLSLPPPDAGSPAVPDFAATFVDQLVVVQSRIDDVLRSNPTAEQWLTEGAESYQETKMDPAEAGRIVEEELADLRAWLQERWESTPRDTRAVEKLLKYLLGGRKVVGLSEAAPYLLALVVATHGAVFGPIDLLIIGGFSAATWLGEKLSNEVTRRTRATNRQISERFEQLACEQVERVRQWLDRRAPQINELNRLERIADEISEGIENART